MVTSSVFDLYSLQFLLKHYDIPFVKIANNRSLDWLIGHVPRRIPVYVSIDEKNYKDAPAISSSIQRLTCVSKYPCKASDYKYMMIRLTEGISDHTTNWDLYNKYKPEIYECHYVLEHDPNNLDGGLFARTIDQLKEVL
jgi:sialic acid synthase SpsE